MQELKQSGSGNSWNSEGRRKGRWRWHRSRVGAGIRSGVDAEAVGEDGGAGVRWGVSRE